MQRLNVSKRKKKLREKKWSNAVGNQMINGCLRKKMQKPKESLSLMLKIIGMFSWYKRWTNKRNFCKTMLCTTRAISRILFKYPIIL